MWSRFRAWWAEAWWIARGVVGANAYEVYLAHHRGTGCTHAPISEKEFWRQKYAREDADPGARCC